MDNIIEENNALSANEIDHTYSVADKVNARKTNTKDLESLDYIPEAEEVDEPQEKKKPELNNARIHQFGTYRLFYDISQVDIDQNLWKGRPVPEANIPKGAPGMADVEKSWVIFSRVYTEQNDWDKVYPEYEIRDEEMFGQTILCVPKEKIIFSYNEPTGAGIILPMPGVFKG